MLCMKSYFSQWLFILMVLFVTTGATVVIDSTYHTAEPSSSGFVHLRREGEPQRKLNSLLAEGKRAAM